MELLDKRSEICGANASDWSPLFFLAAGGDNVLDNEQKYPR